jgi:hypothetical protein
MRVAIQKGEVSGTLALITAFSGEKETPSTIC